jgi:hypothetical protein
MIRCVADIVNADKGDAMIFFTLACRPPSPDSNCDDTATPPLWSPGVATSEFLMPIKPRLFIDSLLPHGTAGREASSDRFPLPCS